MKLINWVSWLLAVGLCLAEARYRMRRPVIPPPPAPPSHLLKKPWPITSRISMGNNFHIGGGFPHKRMSYKPPPTHRIRRPPSMFNVLQTTWKNHVPMLSTMNNHAVLPQRPPVKDFYSTNKASEYSPEYMPEYRPESSQLAPTHRRDIDDDKGPIHTIPAPNLSPADKPYTAESNVPVTHSEKSINNLQRQSSIDDIPHYNTNYQINPLANIGFGILSTTGAPQRTILTSSTSTPHQYEVTETNEINHTIQPNYVVPEIDVTRVADLINSDLQGNEVFLNHPTGPSLIQSNLGTVGTNVQYGQTNVPMQTNLHVRFPGTAVAQAPYEIDPRIPNFQDLIQQQQLAELLQPNVLTTFSQPQMQSFNYDEQANKQQQQQQKHILVGQNYASGKVTADYNLESEATDERSNINQSSNEQLDFIPDATEQSDNNIEFEETNSQKGETTYFNKVTNNGGAISSQFYTTLPSREAAEKLAALAAAGNVNSQLIEQLRKQQQQQQQQDQPQDDEPIPANHKVEEDYQMTDEEQEQNRYDRQQQQYDQQQQQQQHYDQQREQLEEYEQRQLYNQQQKYDQYDEQQEYEQEQYQPQYQEEENKKYPENQSTRISGHTQQRFSEKKRNQSQQNENQRVIKLMVPNVDQNNDEANQEGNVAKSNGGDIEYDYIDDKDVVNSKTVNSSGEKTSYNHSSTKFGTRLNTKTSNQNHQ